MLPGGFFRQLRIVFLLFALFIVGVDTYLTRIRSTDWDLPLRIVVYPINGDGSEITQQYIESLTPDAYQAIDEFMQEEAKQYQLTLQQPAMLALAPQVHALPPRPPGEDNMLKVMWWSLKLRYWAFNVDDYKGPHPDVRIFVVYYDPDQSEHLDHSLGLQKGLLGVVNAFADKGMEEQNNIVIAHEFLHTVGATDKYDLATGQPRFPAGYVEPDRDPLYPQEFAEIMAGTIPQSKTKAVMPKGLFEAIIGKQTAREINWIQ